MEFLNKDILAKVRLIIKNFLGISHIFSDCDYVVHRACKKMALFYAECKKKRAKSSENVNNTETTTVPPATTGATVTANSPAR